MLNNYLKSACSNLLRQGSHTLITVFGLALGMTGCIMIMLYVLASLATVAIAWSAIMLHVVGAANAKPVLALRYE